MPQQRERWKRGVQLVNGALGEAVGQIYVQRHYPPASERQMNELIANLRAALRERLASNSWMDAATRTEALAKLDAFEPRVGHPATYIGAIGAIIGHEIGHGFDDQGSQFNGSGRFANWWTPAARTAFTQRTTALVQQYNGYEGVPGTHINGQLTLGENIGDLGGIEMAYAAYHRYLAAHGPAPVIDGLTGDQRFFLAFAPAWQSKIREGALRQRLLTDPHSPPFFRVNGIVRNVDAWYAAFNVRPGDHLYLPPEQRVHIW